MGRVQPALTPAQARFGAAAMAVLSLLALLTAGLQATAGDLSVAMLFFVLAGIGSWQVMYYRRSMP